jgi:flagellar export protein FliJ
MANDYKLQALLDLRRQDQENAENEYAREVQELTRREDFVATKKADLADAVARRKRNCVEHDARLAGGEVTMSQIRLFDDFLSGLKHDELQLEESIARASRSLEQQVSEVAKAKAELIEATKEVKAVEKHRQNWEEDQETKAQRKRSAAMDEIAARRWMENK